MVYFRSTDIEQRNYHRLLWSVPDEWFYFLMVGDHIEVIDKSSNHRGKVERIFIPVLNDLFNCFSIRKEIPDRLDLREHFDAALVALHIDNFLKTKFKFWTKKLDHHVHITAKTIHVNHEENPFAGTKIRYKEAL
jgi:hypothetical protein